MKDMPDGWTTPEGELYNVQEVYEGTTVLAYGENGKNRNPKSRKPVSGLTSMVKLAFSEQPLAITTLRCPLSNTSTYLLML